MNLIIVFGPSGCGKREFLQRFSNQTAGVLAIELEREWENFSGKSWQSVLGKPFTEREEALEQTLNQLLHRAKKENPRLCLLGLHATHYVDGSFSSPIPIEALKEADVSLCITAFDDLYAMRHRLRRRYGDFSYQQLLMWRTIEFILADTFARTIVHQDIYDPPNMWLAVKHPIAVVRRLLFEPRCPKVYSAFPISRVLQENDRSERKKILYETIVYRRKLHQKNLVVFDPSTLDDRIIINRIMNDCRPEEKDITIPKDERLPYVIASGGDYQPSVPDPTGAFPLTLSHFEAWQLKEYPRATQGHYNLIDAQITDIDLRYVRQADFVTAWRPFFGGSLSAGCRSEAEEASRLEKEVIAYSPAEDREKWRRQQGFESRPLAPTWPPVGLCEDEDDFWDSVEQAIARVNQSVNLLQGRG